MKDHHKLIKFHLLALAVVAVWGVTFVSTKVLIGHMPHPRKANTEKASNIRRCAGYGARSETIMAPGLIPGPQMAKCVNYHAATVR